MDCIGGISSRLAALVAGTVSGVGVAGVVAWATLGSAGQYAGLTEENVSRAAGVAVLFLMAGVCLHAISPKEKRVTRRARRAATRASEPVVAASAAQERRSEERVQESGLGVLQWSDPSRQPHTERIQIRDCSAGGRSLEMSARAPVGQVVWLAHTDELLKAMVRHCQPTDNGHRLGLYLVQKERRRTDRVVEESRAKLHWPQSDGSTDTHTVVVQNFTPSGVQLRAPKPIPVGQTVRLSGQKVESAATTLYCTPEGGQYLVGVQFCMRPQDKTKVPRTRVSLDPLAALRTEVKIAAA